MKTQPYSHFLSVIVCALLAASCSESEFAAKNVKDKEDPVRVKGKGGDVVAEPIETIESDNPYRPVLQVGGDGDVIGAGGGGASANTIMSDDGKTSANAATIDVGNGTTVALDAFFTDPTGMRRDAAITVTNTDTFKFNWKAVNTTSCKVFVKKKSDTGAGDEKPVNGATFGTIDQPRIIVTHTFTATCVFKGSSGAEEKIEKSLDANVDGGWFNAYKLECPAFCTGLSKRNIASPDGFSCTSGEERPISAIGVVDFSPTGCWHSCSAPEGGSGAVSVGQRCYHPTQKKDNDRTDWTVGCYCKK